ncbi:sensor histidine kinase N-terminal domain-containing protein [Oceanimonas sp. NS1]|nr:sensor histidine kinase N-terminal domain-containing protein [Oceanimonas sp. NS1]
MTPTDDVHHPALRRRLLVLSGVVLTVLALLALALMHNYARRTADRSYDMMLNSAILQLGQSVRHTGQGFAVDLPVAAFATLAQAPQDRVFYRISVNGEVLTGYPDLPAPPPRAPEEQALTQARPDFFNLTYQDEAIRVARLVRLNTERLPQDEIVIELAQTRLARDAMAEAMLHPALELMLAVLAVALGLLWLGIYYAFSPFRQLARALSRRSPRDLTPWRCRCRRNPAPARHHQRLYRPPASPAGTGGVLYLGGRPSAAHAPGHPAGPVRKRARRGR